MRLFSFSVLLSCLLLTSCYSVRLKVSNGPGGEPSFMDTDDPMTGLHFRKMDTIVKVKTTTDENPINIRDCESGSLHLVEYKTTFGGILTYLVTFGRKRKVKVTYVCSKDQN